MPGKRKDDTRQQVKRMLLSGATFWEVSKKLNITYASVSYFARTLTSAGEIPRSNSRKPRLRGSFFRREMRRLGVGCGSLENLINGMTDDQIRWLCEQVPAGGTVADVVRAILVDTYFEERGA